MADDLLAELDDYQNRDAQQAIDDAVATVQAYCGWQVSPATTDTVTVWSPDGQTISLETLYLTAVTSVTQDGLTVPASSYLFEPYGVIRAAYGAYFSTLTRLTVVYTHGYAVWPDDAKGVILSLAQRSIANNRGLVTQPGSATSASVLVENYGPRLTDGDKAKLDSYAITAGFA